MKAFVTALAMMFATPAFATSLITHQEFVFQSVEINGQPSRLTGVVDLDHVNGEITVRLYNDRCGSLLPSGPGVYRCLAMPTLESEFSVKMTGQRDGCGTVTYSGKEDLRPVDGILTQISVADHRERRCDNLIVDVLETTVVTHFLRAPHPTIYSLTKPVL